MKNEITTLLILFVMMILYPGGSLQANDSIPQKSFQDYTGKYTFPDNDLAKQVKVVLNNDTLLVVSDMGSVRLNHLTGDRFEVTDYSVFVEFMIDETTKKVVGVKVLYPEGDLEIIGKKEND